MRKINVAITFDSEFKPTKHLHIKEDEKLTHYEGTFATDRFHPQERLSIIQVNEILVKEGQPPLTEEEEDWFINPTAISKDPSPEELQELSGFTVEKKIIYQKD